MASRCRLEYRRTDALPLPFDLARKSHVDGQKLHGCSLTILVCRAFELTRYKCSSAFPSPHKLGRRREDAPFLFCNQTVVRACQPAAHQSFIIELPQVRCGKQSFRFVDANPGVTRGLCEAPGMLALGFGCDTIAVEAMHVFGNVV